MNLAKAPRFNAVTCWLIQRAKLTPYTHIEDYMERYWLVPYADPAAGTGCGPVSFWRRPVAWLLQQFGVAIRVHHILRSDYDRAYHDHPWNYATLVMRGGYTEITPHSGFDCHASKLRFYNKGCLLFREATSWHRIRVIPGLEPWTLFVTGPRKQDWGFLSADGSKVLHEVYKGIP